MNESFKNNSNDSVESLIMQLEKLYERQIDENNRIQLMKSSLERFSEIINVFEKERTLEADLNKKINLLNESLDRVVNIQKNLINDREGTEKTIIKIVRGTKMLGQIMSAVATSIQMTIDNIELTPDIKEKSKTVKTQDELIMFLQPLNNMMKGLVEDKLKEQEIDTTLEEEGDINEKV